MDFWDKLGDSIIKVGETAGMNAANLIGGSSAATKQTAQDTSNEGVKIAGVNMSATALVLTVGAVIGSLFLVTIIVK